MTWVLLALKTVAACGLYIYTLRRKKTKKQYLCQIIQFRSQIVQLSAKEAGIHIVLSVSGNVLAVIVTIKTR